MVGFNKEEIAWLVKADFPFDGTTKEQKEFARINAKMIDPDSIEKLPEPQKSEALIKMHAISNVLSALKRGEKIEPYSNTEAANYKGTSRKDWADFYEFFHEIFPGFQQQHYYTVDELSEPTDISELNINEFIDLMENDSIKFKRSDGTVFSLGNAQYDFRTHTYMYDFFEEDDKDKVAHNLGNLVYLDLEPSEIYEVVSTDEGYKSYTDVFFGRDRLKRAAEVRIPNDADDDSLIGVGNSFLGTMYSDVDDCDYYASPILSSIQAFSSISVDLRLGYDVKIDKDYMQFFKFHEYLLFEPAFYLKAGEKIQIADDITIYSYLYKKQEEDEPQIIYVDMKPEDFYEEIGSWDGYNSFVNEFLSDERVTAILADEIATFGEESRTPIGMGFAGGFKYISEQRNRAIIEGIKAMKTKEKEENFVNSEESPNNGDIEF